VERRLLVLDVQSRISPHHFAAGPFDRNGLEFKLGHVDNNLPDRLDDLNKNFFFSGKRRRGKVRRKFDLVPFGERRWWAVCRLFVLALELLKGFLSKTIESHEPGGNRPRRPTEKQFKTFQPFQSFDGKRMFKVQCSGFNVSTVPDLEH